MGLHLLFRPSHQPQIAMALEEFDRIENCRFSPVVTGKMQRQRQRKRSQHQRIADAPSETRRIIGRVDAMMTVAEDVPQLALGAAQRSALLVGKVIFGVRGSQPAVSAPLNIERGVISASSEARRSAVRVNASSNRLSLMSMSRPLAKVTRRMMARAPSSNSGLTLT
jgi:hypothetical protein